MNRKCVAYLLFALIHWHFSVTFLCSIYCWILLHTSRLSDILINHIISEMLVT